MEERIMFAVIADQLSTEVTPFKLNMRLRDLDDPSKLAMVKNLAENNPAWKDVLSGSRVGVIFDAASGVKISVNRDSEKFIIEL